MSGRASVSVRPAAGVISLCCAVCRQNRGSGVYWIPESLICHGHPLTRCPPPLTPDLLTTVYRVSLEFSLFVELSQNRHFPTTPDTWSRPFGTCICSTCWDQSFFRTCYFSGLCSSNIPRYFLDFAYFLLQTIWIKLKEIKKKWGMCLDDL